MRWLRALAVLIAVLTTGCPAEPEAEEYVPDIRCPGDADSSCAPVYGAPLMAGAAVESIVPACYEDWQDLDGNGERDISQEPYNDCGCDRLCPGDSGYTAPDPGEGDGAFQAIWMAGGSNALPVLGVRPPELGLRGEGDGLWARAIALRQGNTTVVIVAVDLVGVFHDDVLRIREALAERDPAIDHLALHSTHVHAGPDTMGLWGRTITDTGYNPEYAAQMRAAVVEAALGAVAHLEPVQLVVGSVDAADYSADNGIANVCGDTRDPWVIDSAVGAARFVGIDGDTVATLVSFGMHPETMLGDNAFMTSDFVHALRETVSDGVTWQGSSQPGVGGTTIYLNSAVGGMMTMLHITPTDPDGESWGKSWEKMDVLGQLLGGMALDALAAGERHPNPQLAIRMKRFKLPIDNRALQAMAILEVIDRATYEWDPGQPVSDDNYPWLETEIDLIDIGPLRLLTIPGELLPELAIGGYDGSALKTPLYDLVSEENPAPPDLASAPAGPYFKDLMGGRHRWIVGLGNDEIGYVIPEYDFVVDHAGPYVFEPDGDHYEETNSLGPSTAALLEEELRKLVAWPHAVEEAE